MRNTKTDWKNIGLAKLIYRLRQDIDLHRLITLNADNLKTKGISDAFMGHVQQLSLESIVVGICKIYEYESKYELNSISGVINSIPQIAITQELLIVLKNYGEKYGYCGIPQNTTTYLRDTLECFKKQHEPALNRFKEFRDKVAVHNEYKISIDRLPSHGEFEAYFAFARDFYFLISDSLIDVGHALIGRQVSMGFINLMKMIGIENPIYDFKPKSHKKLWGYIPK